MSRVAVVTGGASGIGLGVARRLLADGNRVALLDITADTWDQIIAVNLTGTFTCVQAAVPDMAHYAASKGGVIGLTKALAFLCSEDGGYITGQVIGVNGGMYI